MGQVKTAVLVLCLASAALGQGTAPQKVLVPLIVMNSHEEPITGLKPTSLIVTEDKKPVTDVELLPGQDLPLELGILIDTSGSERESGTVNQIIAAAKDFIADVVRSPNDRFFLMTFAARTRATRWLKREQLSDVSLEVKLEGATTLYDSLAIACRDRLGPQDWNKPTRRILIVISDGEDNQSHVSEKHAISEALHSGAAIFAVDTHTVSSQIGRGHRVMRDFAEDTGGKLFADFNSKEIAKTFQQMKLTNEGMYYARYSPPISNNKVHRFEVKPAPQEKLKISYPKYQWVQ